MTRRRGQAGLSLVELIIGMGVTTLVLTGMVAIVFTITNTYNLWVDRIGNASNGDVLAAAIQADAHRFLTCSTSQAELDFCQVDGTRTVTYVAQVSAPYAVSRVTAGGSQLMVRGSASRPRFHIDCDGSGAVDSGYIEANGIAGLGALRVYFRSPTGPCREI
jgi:Tfp pilus assembly protein PilW